MTPGIGIIASAHVQSSGGGGLTFTDKYAADVDYTQTVITASGLNIGTASSSRTVIIYLTGRFVPARANAYTGVTIGGVTATLAIQYSGSGRNHNDAVYYANVPTGTTADVVVTLGATNMYDIGIGVWTFDGSITIDDTLDNGDTTASKSLSPTTSAGGYVIAGFTDFDKDGLTGASSGWGGVTQDDSSSFVDVSGYMFYNDFASATTDGSSPTITITADSGYENNVCLTVVSFH